MDILLVLPSQRLVLPATDDDFVICQSARMNMCLCYKVDVNCILQLMMTLLFAQKSIWHLDITSLIFQQFSRRDLEAVAFLVISYKIPQDMFKNVSHVKKIYKYIINK